MVSEAFARNSVDFYCGNLVVIFLNFCLDSHILEISTNKAELVKLNGYGSIAVNDEAANIFILFTLNLSHIYSKNMWNQMEINWHVLTLFAIQYINLLDGINQFLMSSLI